MRDGVIGNLLKTALSHFLKFHIFAFAVSVFVVMNSLVKQVLDSLFFVVGCSSESRNALIFWGVGSSF